MRQFTDLYDVTADELYEAKGTATRDAIRRAIGQVFDYRRHIPRPAVNVAVLLPHRPSDDLLDLLLSVAIACVYEESSGDFVRVEAG